MKRYIDEALIYDFFNSAGFAHNLHVSDIDVLPRLEIPDDARIISGEEAEVLDRLQRTEANWNSFLKLSDRRSNEKTFEKNP